ncbi:MAG: amidase [Acidimicrobiia bacterium]|nr:amidase [Acidimicrobiia bacterium]
MIDGAAALAARIRCGELSARDAVDACLRAVDAVNGALNAVVQLVPERARAEAAAADDRYAAGGARGPLHGVPVTIKDCFATEGIITSVGTTGLRSFVPDADDVTVARLRAAGAIVIGKTNCPELLLGFESDNLVYGRTVNPFDAARSCGGSSGGEAAIVAAGASPLGLGSDSGGSLRVPAHFCGVPTIKPTHGRVPTTSAVFPGVGPFSRLRAVGPLAPTVDDLVLGLEVLAGPDGRDPWAAPVPLSEPAALAGAVSNVDVGSLRVAVYTDDGSSTATAPTAETVAAVDGAARALERAGAFVDSALLPVAAEAVELYTGILGGDGGAGLRRALEAAGTTEPSPPIANMLAFLSAGSPPASQYADTLARWDRFRLAAMPFLDRFDVVLSPVAAVPAPPHGTTFEHIGAFGYVFTHNLTGWPAAVVRAGTSPDGLPIGVQVAAGPWREDRALAVARVLESALGPFAPPTIAA